MERPHSRPIRQDSLVCNGCVDISAQRAQCRIIAPSTAIQDGIEAEPQAAQMSRSYENTPDPQLTGITFSSPLKGFQRKQCPLEHILLVRATPGRGTSQVAQQ